MSRSVIDWNLMNAERLIFGASAAPVPEVDRRVTRPVRAMFVKFAVP